METKVPWQIPQNPETVARSREAGVLWPVFALEILWWMVTAGTKELRRQIGVTPEEPILVLPPWPLGN